jgi:alpha-N-arabinofuranosidase
MMSGLLQWRTALGLSMWFWLGVSLAQCLPTGGVARDTSNWVQADALQPVRLLESSFFGFNLEWLEFQRGLWEPATRQVRPGVTDLFKAFPGAVYRFPGGTNSNHIDWRDAVGPIAARAPRKHVTWMGPIRPEFGVDEYLQFVRSVNGQAWYVANLYGSLEGAVAPGLLASNAGELAAYLTKRAVEGYPPVLRWELGNELDRAQYKWPPEKLAQIALQVAGPIAEKAPGAKFVHLQQEYPAQQDRGYTANRYNKELRAQLVSLKPEYAMHFYFDGPPDTPPIEYFLRQLCQVVDQAKSEGSNAKVWVTESGRVPNGFWAKTPKELWPATANLEAAISVADMLIALAYIPEAQGAFTHSLVANNSPWPMVHVRANGEVGPSATLLALKVLRELMLPVVLLGRQASSATGTLGASYVVRSVITADAARDNFSAWAINRSNTPQVLDLRISNAKESLSYERSIGITDEQVNASNYAVSNRVEIARNHLSVNQKGRGTWSITLPPNSVSALRFSVPK